MVPRTGRPKLDPADVRSEVVPVRLTLVELATVKAAADLAGMSLSGYLRVKGLAAAKRARQ